MAVNTCLSHIRSRNQRNNLIESTIDPEILLIPESAGNENDFIEENKMIFLQQFLLNLSMADRTLVSLYLENLSTKEMAEVTGMSETNLRVRIHRIKEKIKKEWEEKQNGTG